MLLLILAAGSAALSACGSDSRPKAAPQETAPPRIDPRRLASAYASISPDRAKDLSHPYTVGKIVVVSKGEDDEGNTLGEPLFNSAARSGVEQLGKASLMADVVYMEGGSTQANSEVVTNPNEVGTVVWISCTQFFAGSYSNGEESYRTDCTASIIDTTKNLIVGETTRSSDPPQYVRCPMGQTCGPYYGGFDDEGFSRYLVALPRKVFTEPIVP